MPLAADRLDRQNVPARGQARRRSRGFTLIELMIAVAIVGILAAVALPAYTDYLRRGRIPEAHTYLSSYRVQLEQYYQDNRRYGSAGVCAPDSGGATTILQFPSGTKYFGYTCSLDDASGQTYTLTATSRSAMASGHTYTINQANARTTSVFKNAAVAKDCWLVKGDEC